MSDKGLLYLKNLPHLVEVSLLETDVESTGLRHLKMLRRLERFDVIYGNDQINRGTKHIFELPTLRHLEIRQTPLTDTGAKGLGKLRLLEYLSLADTKITDDSASELVKLTSLKWLSLPWTNLGDCTIASVAKLSHLESVDIRWTRATRRCLLPLEKLPHLKSLDVGPLSREGDLSGLQRFPSLTYLCLQDCDLSKDDICALCCLTKLEVLSMYGCTAPKGSTKRLKAALPEACEDLKLKERS